MHPACPGVTRRSFLADTGMGFTGLALAALLHQDGAARAADPTKKPDGKPHFPPKAKNAIWVFLCGGVSHVESFDVKPKLTKYHGKTIDVEHILSESARLGIGVLGWSWKGNSEELAYLDLAEDWEGKTLTPWGNRLFHGEHGIKNTAQRASLYVLPAVQ